MLYCNTPAYVKVLEVTVMKMNKFYRRQLGANISYFIWMWFLGIFAVLCFAFTIIFFLEAFQSFDIIFSGDPIFRSESLSEIILANMLMFGFFGFFAGAFVYSWVRIGKRRKKLY